MWRRNINGRERESERQKKKKERNKTAITQIVEEEERCNG